MKRKTVVGYGLTLFVMIIVFCASLSCAIGEVTSEADAKALLTNTIEIGKIKLMVQTKTDSHFKKDYWPSSGSPGSLCTRGAFSMALSYLGIECTPKWMEGKADWESGNGYDNVLKQLNASDECKKKGVSLSKISVMWNAWKYSSLTSAYNRYLNDESYSPLLIWGKYTGGQGKHAMLLVGMTEVDEKSIKIFVVDPSGWTCGTGHVGWLTINKSDGLATNMCSGLKQRYTNYKISRALQWHIEGAGFAAPITRAVYKTKTDTYMFKSADVSSESISFPGGLNIVVTGQSSKNGIDWYKTTYGTFIKKNDVEYVRDAPAIGGEKKIIDMYMQVKVKMNGLVLTIRDEPYEEGVPLMLAPTSAKLTSQAIYQNRKGEYWLQVDFNGIKGYCPCDRVYDAFVGPRQYISLTNFTAGKDYPAGTLPLTATNIPLHGTIKCETLIKSVKAGWYRLDGSLPASEFEKMVPQSGGSLDAKTLDIKSSNINTLSGSNLIKRGSASYYYQLIVDYYVFQSVSSVTQKPLKTETWESPKYYFDVGGGDENPLPDIIIDVAVTGISINPAELSLNVGEEANLSHSISPSDATNKNVEWISNNTDVVKVNSSGQVTAVAEGEATIIAKSQDGRNVCSNNCIVRVYGINGSCGENASWRLNGSTLEISGTGPMDDYEMWQSPWTKYNDRIKKIIVNSGITKIGNCAFVETAAEEIVLPEGITYIGISAFRSTRIPMITLPASLLALGDAVFDGCTLLESITLPENITSLPNRVFEDCHSLKTVNHETALTYIGYYAFLRCRSLESFMIQPQVQSVTTGCFSGCSSLTSVIVGNGVNSIENDAFSNCPSLAKVFIPETVTKIDDTSFLNSDNLTIVCYPKSAAEQHAQNQNINYSYMIEYNTISNYPELKLGEQNVSDIAYGSCSTYYRFVPQTTGRYTFSSSAEDGADTRTYLLDEYWNVIAEDDDSGDQLNFSLTYELQAGKPYYYAARYYSGLTTGSFNVLLERYAAVNGVCGDSASWSYDNGALTISGNGETYDYEEFADTPWSHLASKIQSIIVEEGITAIGKRAFSYVNAKTVNLPYGLETIKERAFEGCSFLQGIELPHSLKRIDDWAFTLCPGIESIVIPSSVQSIGHSVFLYCDHLADISVHPSNGYFRDWNGALFDKDLKTLYAYPQGKAGSFTIPDGTERIEWGAFEDCDLLESVTIPDSVTHIGIYAFADCDGISELHIPESVERIYDGAISACSNLVYVIIPGNTIIDDNWNGATFAGCNAGLVIHASDNSSAIQYARKYGISYLLGQGLCGENVAWSYRNGVLTVTGSGRMFDYNYSNQDSLPPWSTFKSGIRQIVVGENVSYIGTDAFSGCENVTSVSLPASLMTIGNYAFYNCSSLDVIDLPNGLNGIGDSAFRKCKQIKDISIPDSVVYVGPSVFSECSGATSLTLSKGMSTIFYNCFNGCTGLTSVTIPENITTIGYRAFESCNNLREISIQHTVTSIDASTVTNEITNSAFAGDENLIIACYDDTAIYYYAIQNGIPYKLIGGSCGENARWNWDAGCLYISGYGAMMDYAGHSDAPWQGLKANIESAAVEEGITSIGENAFYHLNNLRSISLPDSIKEINAYAFDSCALSEIKLPGSLETIGNYAFEYCDGIKTISIPDTCYQIGEGVFQACTKLENIDVDIGNARYASFEGVLYSKDLISLHVYPAGKPGRTYDIIPGTQRIEWGAFEYNPELRYIAIPDSVTFIDAFAFFNCIGLSELRIPDGVKNLYEKAFASCHALDTIYMSSEINPISYSVFENCDAKLCFPSKDGLYFDGDDSGEGDCWLGNVNLDEAGIIWVVESDYGLAITAYMKYDTVRPEDNESVNLTWIVHGENGKNIDVQVDWDVTAGVLRKVDTVHFTDAQGTSSYEIPTDATKLVAHLTLKDESGKAVGSLDYPVTILRDDWQDVPRIILTPSSEYVSIGEDAECSWEIISANHHINKVQYRWRLKDNGTQSSMTDYVEAGDQLQGKGIYKKASGDSLLLYLIVYDDQGYSCEFTDEATTIQVLKTDEKPLSCKIKILPEDPAVGETAEIVWDVTNASEETDVNVYWGFQPENSDPIYGFLSDAALEGVQEVKITGRGTMYAGIVLYDHQLDIQRNAFSQIETYNASTGLIVLPKNLKTIEAEAFLYTAANTFDIPAGVMEISPNAFAPDAILLVEKDSFAETWAKENGVSYKVK